MNWIKDNWKWFVPLIVAVIFCVGFFFMMSLKKSDVYKIALEKVQNSKQIEVIIGAPIKPGFIVGGTIKWAGSSGTANISFPIHGEKGTGIVYGVAEKNRGNWSFHTLKVKIEDDNGNRWIDLI